MFFEKIMFITSFKKLEIKQVWGDTGLNPLMEMSIS